MVNASNFADKRVAALLECPGGNIAYQLLALETLPNKKRTFYNAFARLCPKQRQTLLTKAEQMNFTVTFPYHFLDAMVERMK